MLHIHQRKPRVFPSYETIDRQRLWWPSITLAGQVVLTEGVVYSFRDGRHMYRRLTVDRRKILNKNKFKMLTKNHVRANAAECTEQYIVQYYVESQTQVLHMSIYDQDARSRLNDRSQCKPFRCIIGIYNTYNI